MKFIKRFVCAFCAAFMLLSSAGAVSDAQSEIIQKIDKIKAENDKRAAQISALGKDLASSQAAMKLVSEQIDGIKAEISEHGRLIDLKTRDIEDKSEEIKNTQDFIRENERDISEKTAEIAGLRTKNRDNLEKFAKLARALYMNDPSGALPVLNGSKNWYEFYVYSDVVRNISEQNTAFVQKILSDIDDQEIKIEALNKEISELEAVRDKLSREKSALEKQSEELENEKIELEKYCA